MTERDPRFLSDLPHRIREQLQTLPELAHDWHARLRSDPGAVLRSPLLRLAGLLLLLIAAGGSLAWLAGAFTPAIDPGRIEAATPTATLFVACTNPDCLADAVVKQPRDFSAWPLPCQKCGRPTVYRARQCPTCGGWFAAAPGQVPVCSLCARAARARESRPADAKPDKPPDAEDWW